MKKDLRVCSRAMICALSVTVGSACVVAGTPLVLLDTEFDPASWETMTRLGRFASDVTSFASQVPSGGNPDACREMIHTVTNSSPGEFAFGWIWHRNTAEVVSLAAAGIDAVCYRADYRFISSSTDQGATAYAAIFQGGEVFLHGIGVVSASGWGELSSCGLGEEDFRRLLPDGSGTDSMAHPDFSQGAGDLTFGYAYSNTPLDDAFTITHAIDNWRFEVTSGAAACPGDFDGNNLTDLADLLVVLANFGQSTATGDTDGSGVVDLTDLLFVLSVFGQPCP